VSGLAVVPPRSAVTAGALRRLGPAAGAAAALSLVAAWVHLAYTASHWRDWWAYGAFFLAMGVYQGLCAAALVRRPRSAEVAAGVIAGNLAIVGMYVLSRTAGIPMGPHAGVVEEAGAIDLGVTAAEVAIVACAIARLRPRPRRVVVDALLAAGVALWLLRLTDRLP
jgi:hypothetical protein